MRILFVTHSFPPDGEILENLGGMQRVAVGLHRALASHPEVHLETLALETSWKRTPWRVGPFLAKAVAGIPRRVREDRIDVVLFSSMVTAAVAPLIRKRVERAGCRLAAIPIGRDVILPTRPYQWYLRRVFDALDHAFPISRVTADACIRRGMERRRVRVIPCGVDPESFAPPPDRAVARRALLDHLSGEGVEVPADALLMLSVGRHQPRKGFHWTVREVIPRLPDGIVYLLAGSGPMTPQIRDDVERLGVGGDRVKLLGRVSEEELRRLYRGSDLFLMPNLPMPGDVEGFGVVMLEAGMAGTPVLAAEMEGIRDVIDEGCNGHFCPPGEAECFVRAIEEYAKDREALLAAGRITAEFTRASFAWPAIADRFVQALGEGVAAEPLIDAA
jgi:phosphatidyl-myo-inositol dimannoside synthase